MIFREHRHWRRRMVALRWVKVAGTGRERFIWLGLAYRRWEPAKPGWSYRIFGDY